MSWTRSIGWKPSRSSILITVVIALALGLLWYLDPQHQYQRVGKLSDFAPSPGPYPITLGAARVYVVNTGTELFAINSRYRTMNPAWRCQVVWVPTNTRYEDPCSGAKFDLDGSWLSTAYVPAELEPRGLERWAVQVRNGEVWVNRALVTPGAVGSTSTP